MPNTKKIGLLYETYSVYIMTNYNNTALYTGVSSELVERCVKHRNKEYPDSFTARYNINKLVFFEDYNDINVAIAREKQIKAGSRKRKIELIVSINPLWQDLFETKIGIDYL